MVMLCFSKNTEISLQRICYTLIVSRFVALGFVAEKGPKTLSALPSYSAIHCLSFSGEVSDCRIAAFAVDSVQGISYRIVPAAKPSRGTHWYHICCCVNVRSVWLGQLLPLPLNAQNETKRIGHRARHQRPRSGFQ